MSRKLIRVGVEVLIGGILLSIVSDIISDYTKALLSGLLGPNATSPLLYRFIIWTAVALILLAYILLKYRMEFRQDKELFFKTNRKQFINNLKGLYHTALESKLHNDIKHRVDLTLSYTTIGSSADVVAQHFDQELLQAGIDGFEDLYQNLNNRIIRLLILGEPGSGKSTLLLQFALKLLEEAERQKDKPIPLLLNLSNWTSSEKSLEDWLEGNLSRLSGTFIISSGFAKDLSVSGKVVLLLDGFDEIQERHRSDFLGKLEQYLEKRKKEEVITAQLILCSRIDEYKEIVRSAPVQASVLIQPINSSEVTNLLKHLNTNHPIRKNAAAKLLAEIEANPSLTALLDNAFYLNLAFNIKASLKYCRSTGQLLDIYIREQLDNTGKYSKETIARTLRWLTRNQWEHGLGLKFELVDLSLSWTKLKYLIPVLTAICLLILCRVAYDLLAPLNDFYVSYSLLNYIIAVILFTYFLTVGANFKITPKKLSIQLISLKRVFIALAASVIGFLILTILPLYRWAQDILDIYALKATMISNATVIIFFSVLTLFYVDAPLSYQKTPFSRLYSNIKYALINSLLLAVPILFTIAATGIFTFYSLIFILPVVVLIGTIYWSNILLFFFLYLVTVIEHRLPLRLARFLNYMAGKTSLMERDGTTWRFRHKLVQDWFINQEKPKEVGQFSKRLLAQLRSKN